MEKVLFIVGNFPLMLFCIYFMLRKKKYLFSIPVFGISALLCFGAGAAILTEDASELSVSAEQYTYLLEVSLDAEDYEKAEDYLDEMYKEFGDIPEVLTGQLRLTVLQENMKEAVLVAKDIIATSEKKELNLSEEEEKFLNEVEIGQYVTVAEYKRDWALYNSLAENGINPEEYGLTEISDADLEAAQKNEKKLKKAVENQIEESAELYEKGRKTESFAEAIKTAQKLDKIMESIRNGELSTDDKTTVKKVAKYAEELNTLYQKEQAVLALPDIQRLYINACVLTEEYEMLLDYADKSNDAGALAVVAYLYLNKEIKDKDFKKLDWEFDYADVARQCKTVYQKLKAEDLEKEEKAAYEECLEAITERSKNEILANIEEKIADSLSGSKGVAENYIQNAAINSELLDNNRVYEYLDKAIAAKETSENQELNTVLDKIEAIAELTANDNEIINFNNYLEESYKQSLMIETASITVPETFLNVGSVYVNEKRAKVNVGYINAENFPEVTVYVSASDLNLAKLDDIQITDCGIQIEDYTIEKARYDRAQIVLVCDNSGSMSGDIEALKAAVRKFIESGKKGEYIGLVTFDSYVLQNVSLTNNTEELLNEVNAFNAYGGTSIASGVNCAMNQYDETENAFNVMIVMTDGQDSSYYYESDLEELRKMCQDKNVVLYTLGLGSVNAEYLKNVADYGMGSFIYANNSTQLEDLYSFIHNQLANNYILKYRAVDKTTLKNREFTIKSAAEEFYVTREYSIAGLEKIEDRNDTETGTESSKEYSLISVKKLGVSTIIGSQKEGTGKLEFTIFGSGFDKASNISVSLCGNRKYAGLEYRVEDSSTLSVVLPDNVEYDTYEVIVVIDGLTYHLKYLTLLKTSEKTEICFGDYVFKAYSIYEKNGSYYLSGNVVMNDYLHFKGDVTLSGSSDGNIMVIEENDGSYISGDGKLPGVLADFFDNRISVPKLNGLTLYKDDHYDRYYTKGASYYGPVKIRDPYISLYPEYLEYSIMNVTIDFPIYNNLLEQLESPFTATGFEKKFILSKDRLGFVLKAESSTNLDKNLKLGKAVLELDSFKLNIDTFHYDFTIGMSVKLDGVPILKNSETAYSFELAIASGKVEQIDFGADVDLYPLTVLVAGAPVRLMSLSDFHFGIQGLSELSQDKSFGKKILETTFYGQTAVNFFKLNKLIPGLDTFLGDILDISILQFADTTLSIKFSDWNLSLDTTANLFECVELGKAEVDLGHYSYENYLLGIEETDVTGVHFKSTTGYDMQFGNWFKLGVDGLTSIDINKAFSGVMMKGNLNYNIKLGKRHTKDMEGVGLLGLHNDCSQFTILIKGSEYQSGNDAGIRITFGGGGILPSFDFY